MENEELEIRSEQIQELLETVPNWIIRYGNILILALLLMFLLLSWFIKYPDIISTEAHITTIIPPQKKYAQFTGKLDTLLVKDNENVGEGSVIAILENNANYSDIKKLKATIDTIKLNNKDFYFPINKMPILFLGNIDTEYALFENNYIQYQLNKEYQPFNNEQRGNQNTITQLKARLRILESQKEINKAELNFQKVDLERQQKLFDKGVIAKQTLESEQLTYLQAERNYANMNASISQIKEAINSTSIAQKSTSINKTREEISLLKSVIQSFNQLKRAIIDWEMNNTIVSDINGKVIYSQLWANNQTINQGQLLFTIIPQRNSTYIAKLKTPTQNSGKVKVGQVVKIKLENYPETEFGSLKGNIKSLSVLPDADGFYLTQVALPDELITSYNKKIEFKYEMRGAAEIITEDLRLIERFFNRVKDIFKT